MATILVTGGACYIGSHTSKLLAQKGYEPVCYDNLSTGHKEFVKWGPLARISHQTFCGAFLATVKHVFACYLPERNI